MSDINIDFTVANIDANFTVATNELSFTPTDLQLNFYTGGYVETATALNANISNVHISGGTNGYVLQTDGYGNLNWTAQTGGGGNGSPGGSNTQIQFNDSGLFAGNAGFTFNKVTGNVNIPSNLTVPGNMNVSGTIYGNISDALHASVADIANSVSGANVSGAVAYATVANSVAGANVSGTVANATYATSAGSANSVAGANVTGQVSNALISGTVYSNAQPNITSVGTLTSLSVSGNTSVTGNVTISGNLFTDNIVNSSNVARITTSNSGWQYIIGGNLALQVNTNQTSVKQINSLVTTGTAPMIINSTTLVPNLYVSRSAVADTVSNSNASMVVNDLTANAFIVPQANNSASLGFSGQRWSNIFVNNVFANFGNVSANYVSFGNGISSNLTPTAASSTTVTHKIPIVLNGTTYYMMLTNTP